MTASMGGPSSGGATLPIACPACRELLAVPAPSAVNLEQEIGAVCYGCGHRVTKVELATMPRVWGGQIGIPSHMMGSSHPVATGRISRPMLMGGTAIAAPPPILSFPLHIGPARPHGGPDGEVIVDEPFEVDRAPDLVDPVLAWRGWAPTPDGHLTAAAQGGIWDEGPNRAICNRYEHLDIPAVGCACGFYGWHRPEDVSHGELRGCFKAWGEIISHDVGIRSEYAEIVVLYDAEQIDTNVLARIADRYKVPIVGSEDEALRYALAQGVAVPMDFRPEPPRSDPAADIAAAASQMLAQQPAPPPPPPTKGQIVIHISAETKKLMGEMNSISQALNNSIQNMAAAMIAVGLTAREARDGFFKLLEAERKAEKKKAVLTAEQRKKLVERGLKP